MRIQVNNRAGVLHYESGFVAYRVGEYDFPDDERWRPWLLNQVERGEVSLVEEEVAPPAEESITPPVGEAFTPPPKPPIAQPPPIPGRKKPGPKPRGGR